MLFHTWIFLAFVAIVYPGHLLLRRTKFGTLWLLCASYIFYGWWNWLYLLLIVSSTTVDFFMVKFMDKAPKRHWLYLICFLPFVAGSVVTMEGLPGWGLLLLFTLPPLIPVIASELIKEQAQKRKLFLVLSLVCNLGLLSFFKYAGFFTENVNVIFGKLGIGATVPAPDVLLPVGISFFVFQSLSYTIDYYRGQVEKEHNFINYAAFVSLFPQLVAGPIERASNLLPQLKQQVDIKWRDMTDGVSLFCVGLFKKVALADCLALYVDQVYGDPESYGGLALILATIAFGWQIYFDFSGYTDMARGVAQTMGFRLMLNFNNPYLATSLGDFWSRWHISLSSWFKHYVYIPLGGNRKGAVRTYVNMFLTMVISGLWHGATWNFVIWGVLHAVGRCATREMERTKFYLEKVPRAVKQALVFTFVTFTWIFFRAETLGDAAAIVKSIFTSGVSDPKFPLVIGGVVVAIWVYEYLYESRLRTFLGKSWVKIAIIVFMVLYMTIAREAGEKAFVYFQF